MSSLCTIELLGTAGCHLCEDAQRVLSDALENQTVQVQLIDIADHDDSERLVRDYGLRIPVLRLNNRELDWPFNAQQVKQWMQCS